LRAADRLGVTGYVSVQPRYNLLYREIETELLPLCRAEGIGVLVYNPLAGGFLSGKHTAGAEPETGGRFTLGSAAGIYRHRYWQEAQFRCVERLAKECEARGLALVSVAVAWVLAQPGVSSAIIGASRAEQLEASLAAAELKLDPELSKVCDELWWELPRRPVFEGYR
jgi:aryl-alcohol dehydrogenase (NADP+)